MIVLIVGDFCVGKDTVADFLIDAWNESSDIEVVKIRSYTTRSPRYEGENTHEFCTEEEFLAFDDLVAQTKIGDHYYGARASQFNSNDINFYVVDDKGVCDILDSDLTDIYVIEVIRPKWLRNCPKERQNRERYFECTYDIDYRIMNDGDMFKLEQSCLDCFDALVKEYLLITQ